MSATPTMEELDQLADEADLSDYEQRALLRNAIDQIRAHDAQIRKQSRDIAELQSAVGIRGDVRGSCTDRRAN